ncbi:semaphorin-7A-like [Salarias fasciatus]|nr:semaphorin-7A-like [Salarias fasciatus]
MAHVLTVYLLLFYLNTVTEANSSLQPRMTFTEKDTTFKSSPSPVQQGPVRVLLRNQPDMVTTVGQTHLNFYNFQNPNKGPTGGRVQWNECSGADCDYSMTVVQQRPNSTALFVCGTNNKEAQCCDVDISETSPSCSPHEKMKNIKESIKGFIDKESEHSILVESEQSADLYITYSGSQDRVGLYKFGSRTVMPANHDKEQHYAGLVLSRRIDSPLQDRVYAFYKQRNRDTRVNSEMWTSFVTQVCMSDVGGPKNLLQFRWTSQLNARMFCGDSERKLLFSELVDTATVHADHWENTKIYGLFRNEWGMSAVCVYTIRDINDVFMNSSFNGQTSETTTNRQRDCVEDSSKISLNILRMIDKNSELEDWIHPVGNSNPLLFSHHNYTHISVDSFQQKDNSQHPVIFLSLNNGRIHKVLQHESEPFIIAEYRPFSHTTHITSINLHSSSKKLYVNSRDQLVQVDVANCTQYGSTCQDCILSRDPYCGWKDGLCTSDTHNALQDVARGNPALCPSATSKSQGARHEMKAERRSESMVSVPFRSRYFLTCPVSSHHAEYIWKSPGQTTNCSSKGEQCVHLIHSMGPEQEGLHQCLSEERGYQKVLAQYQLMLKGRTESLRSGLVFWVCLMTVFVQVFYC